MLPSIRHLLDNDLGTTRTNDAPGPPSSSAPPSPLSLSATTDHHYQKEIPDHRQHNVIAVEGPNPQRNSPQHRQTQHHPHPPYEPLRPLHLNSHEQDYGREPIPIPSPTALGGMPLGSRAQTQPTKHYSYTSGYTTEYDRYYSPSALSDADPPRMSDYSQSPRVSPKNPFFAEGAGDSRRDPRAALTATTWPPRPSVHSQGPPPPPQSAPSSYRSQRRTSPFDPSISSSSSSASPSPSISTATTASTPLTVDAMAAVTIGTAAASISDSRSRHGPNQSSTRTNIRGDYKEPGTDRRPTLMDSSERPGQPCSNSALSSPHGGLVQSAPWSHPHPSPPSYRGNIQDSANAYRFESHHPTQFHSEYASAGYRASKISPSQGARHTYNEQEKNHIFYNGEQRHYRSDNRIRDSSSLFRHPASQETRLPTTYNHSVSPPSPSQRAIGASQEIMAHERKFSREWPARYRDGERNMDSESGPFGQGQSRRYEPLSSPGLSGTHMSQALMNPHPHQQLTPTPHSPHHPSHPSPQQQQHPPPLYDPVRESDQRTFQHPTSHASAQPSQQVHEQSHQSYRQRFATADGVPSASLEAPLPRQPGFQQQGLPTRSERISSPGPSHPYYTPAHPPRSFPSQSSDGDLRYARMKDEGRRSSRRPASPHPSSTNHPMSYPSSPQPNFADGVECRHIRHSSQGYLHTERGSFGSRQNMDSDKHGDLGDRYNQSWSDEASGLDRRSTVEVRRGGKSTMQLQSSSLTTAAPETLHWSGSQRRSIRLSVSESDLQTFESAQKRQRRMVDYPEEDVDEEEAEDADEGEGDDGEEEFDEESEHRQSLQMRPQQQHPRQPYPSDYDPSLESARHGPFHSRENILPSGYRGPNAHSQLPSQSHDESLVHQNYSRQRPQGFIPNASHHPQSYPPRSQQHPNMPHHPGQYQQQQHSTSTLLDNHSNNPSNAKTPNRRGPYLSRQRALLAGLETIPLGCRYQCQYCSKRFSRPSSLRIHTYSHTGERPFKCSEEGCGRQFSVQSNMRRHLRVHRLGRIRSDGLTQDD